MKVELFPFQKLAVTNLRAQAAAALGEYRSTNQPQVLSLQAPTGAGKTIIMAALMEDIYFGTECYAEQPEAIFVWLSDSPGLNAQSRQKIDLKADRIRFDQCVMIEDETFDQEVLDDGHIYFLNTQKLGRNANLGRHSDSRQFTIWETLEKTVREKSDRLYFVIDEAHRGMQGREAGVATTIMQRFIKGERALNLPPMPLVIGISVTAQRFNTLVGDTNSTLRKYIISANDVRSSGLLKDRISIIYSGDHDRYDDMAVLKAACVEWKNKRLHWYQYSQEQHYAQVNPIFIVQVLAGSHGATSDTNLDEVLAVIEEQTDNHFEENQVVHTFGSTGTLSINGLNVPHVAPEDITDDKRIRVVFFKENLSTGWDCPRAETMMSYRHAEDITYIAQLLGRMIRTPLQCHINVDDYLNDVRLYLPYFDRESVKMVIDELQSAEGGEIPVDIDGESLGSPLYQPWSIRPRTPRAVTIPGQLELFSDGVAGGSSADNLTSPVTVEVHPQQEPTPAPAVRPVISLPAAETPVVEVQNLPVPVGAIDRVAIANFINRGAYPTYLVRNTKINDYLASLLKLSSLLVQSNIFPAASAEVKRDVVGMMYEYIEDLHRTGRYDELAKQVLSFKLAVRTFDVFGQSLDGGYSHELIAASENDLDRQLRAADAKLGRYGFPNEYGRKYGDDDNPSAYKIDSILFAADDDCFAALNQYAERRFHDLDDNYRRYIVDKSEQLQKSYNAIVADGDAVSKHNFVLPETFSARIDEDGVEYEDHLLVDDNGVARIKLNTWERGVLEEEKRRSDFVCWLRNPSRASWALAIPYEINREIKPMYPDFIIVRRDTRIRDGYVIDILEPHGPQYKDNFGKAQGLAKYAAEEPRIGRVQLIRESVDPAGRKRFKRLELTNGSIRDKVLRAQNIEELDHIFDDFGVLAQG